MSDPYRFLLRLPADLKEPLRCAAAENGRSLNAEIVARLRSDGGAAAPAGQRRRLLPAAAVALVALSGLGAFAAQRAAPPVSDGAAHSAPLSKGLLLGDPPGSALTP